jgi:hypothetical protein
LDAAGAEVSSSCMVILLVFENDQHDLIAAFRLVNRRPLPEEHLSPPGIVLGSGF